MPGGEDVRVDPLTGAVVVVAGGRQARPEAPARLRVLPGVRG